MVAMFLLLIERLAVEQLTQHRRKKQILNVFARGGRTFRHFHQIQVMPKMVKRVGRRLIYRLSAFFRCGFEHLFRAVIVVAKDYNWVSKG